MGLGQSTTAGSKKTLAQHYREFVETEMNQNDRKLLVHGLKTQDRSFDGLSLDFFKSVQRTVNLFDELRRPKMRDLCLDECHGVDSMGMFYFAVLAKCKHIRAGVEVIPEALAAIALRFMEHGSSVTLISSERVHVPVADMLDEAIYMKDEKRILLAVTSYAYKKGLSTHVARVSHDEHRITVTSAEEGMVVSGKPAGLTFKFSDKIRKWPENKISLADIKKDPDILLGQGTFGKVVRLDKLEEFGEVACKIYISMREVDWQEDPEIVSELENWFGIVGERIATFEDFDTGKINPPNIVPILGLFEGTITTPGIPGTGIYPRTTSYIMAIMPLMEGTLNDVYELFKIHGRTVVAEAALGVAKGVLQMHRNRYVHGDLKPKNTLWRWNDDMIMEGYVADFGSAKRLLVDPEGHTTVSLDYNPWSNGTLTCYPREILKFMRSSTQTEDEEEYVRAQIFKKDMYGLGMTLLYCLVGYAKVNGFYNSLYGEWNAKHGAFKTFHDRLDFYMHTQDVVETNDELFRDIPPCVKQLLANDPKSRPNSKQVVDDLEAYLRTIEAQEATWGQQQRRKTIEDIIGRETIFDLNDPAMLIKESIGMPKEPDNDSDVEYINQWNERIDRMSLAKRFKKNGSTQRAEKKIDPAIFFIPDTNDDDDNDDDQPQEPAEKTVYVVDASGGGANILAVKVKTLKDIIALPRHLSEMLVNTEPADRAVTDRMPDDYEAIVLRKTVEGILPMGNQEEPQKIEVAVQLKYKGKAIGRYSIGKGDVVLTRVIPDFDLLVVLTKVPEEKGVPISFSLSQIGDGFGQPFLVIFDYKKKEHLATIKSRGYYMFGK